MNERRSNYLNMVSKSRLADHGLVLMDDGGSKIKTPEGIQNRQTWVAVLVPPEDAVDAVQQMEGLSDEVAKLFGAEELHAHEIFQLKGPWSNVPIEQLKGIVAAVSEILGSTSFPIVVQTLWKGNESHINLLEQIGDHEVRKTKRKTGFDFRNPKDAAFLLCLRQCREYIKETYPNTKWAIFADEGLMKPGQVKQVPVLWVDGHPATVHFEDSRACKLIQLADYVAFFSNRSQQVQFSSARSPHDEELMDILRTNLNFINIGYLYSPRQHEIGDR